MNDAWSQSDNPAAALVAFFGMMSEEQRQALRDAVRIVQGPEETREPAEARQEEIPAPTEENPGSAEDGDGR